MPSYPLRTLGDDKVSAQGLGCMGMSQAYNSFGGYNDEESLATLTEAADLGITFVCEANPRLKTDADEGDSGILVTSMALTPMSVYWGDGSRKQAVVQTSFWRQSSAIFAIQLGSQPCAVIRHGSKKHVREVCSA